jgi:hypothetical protein
LLFPIIYQKNIGAKAVRKMMVKLNTELKNNLKLLNVKTQKVEDHLYDKKLNSENWISVSCQYFVEIVQLNK